MIKVLEPGLQTTVQDDGRVGFYETGMPPSGAVDQYSYAVSNLLVGNKEGTAALEITYMGPKLDSTGCHNCDHGWEYSSENQR